MTSSSENTNGLFGMIARGELAAIEDALLVSMGRLGYTPAPGLSAASHQPDTDPHERPARFFRLRQFDDHVAIIELGSQQGCDYFLATALASAGLEEIIYASLEGRPPSGALALLSSRREPREAWFENGAIDQELSNLPGAEPVSSIYAGRPGRQTSTHVDSIATALEVLTPLAAAAARLLERALANDTLLDFAADNEEVLAFCRARTKTLP